MQEITAHTKTFAVLGHPIEHSLSPVMHNRSFEALEYDGVYLAYDVEPEALPQTLRAMAAMRLAGVNLTVPLKEIGFQCVDQHAESARLTGSVNTVEFLADGSLRGHSTDGDGFLLALQESFQIDVTGLHMFMLGCGGAGRAVAITSARAGARQITLSDTDPMRIQNLKQELEALQPDLEIIDAGVHPSEWPMLAKAADLIVQATPIGMKAHDPSPLPPETFRRGQCVFDLIYMYPQTAIMKPAAEAGARVANGLGMLLHQGAKAFEIWTGLPADTQAMRAALEDAVYSKYSYRLRHSKPSMLRSQEQTEAPS